MRDYKNGEFKIELACVCMDTHFYCNLYEDHIATKGWAEGEFEYISEEEFERLLKEHQVKRCRIKADSRVRQYLP